ncbi:MAG: hypothetical protein AAF714_02665 [Pseudomonadota bacterium]
MDKNPEEKKRASAISEDFSVGRREFIKNLFGSIGKLSGVATLGAMGIVATKGFNEDESISAGEASDVPGDWKEIIHSLRGGHWIDFDQSTTLMLGKAHDRYRYQESPSFQSAVSPFHSAYLDLPSRKIYASDIDWSLVRGDVINFGSPSSNALMQILMGYRPVEGSSLNLEFIGTEKSFPFKMDLSSNHRSVTRLSKGQEYIEPAWSIEDNSGNTYRPSIRSDGRITSDFLMMTRLENPFLAGRNILSIAGLHGAGTSAIRLLLANPNGFLDLEGKISQVVASSKSKEWQALIPVPRVVEDQGNNLALDLDLKSAQVLPIL